MGATPVEGVVAIHRWFAGGEGWATHPWFGGKARRLADAVAGPLRAPQGEFSVAALGGHLVGETVSDPGCLDPKARDRQPTVLRLVFLKQEANVERRRKLLKQLRQLPLPDSPGIDVDLILPGFPEPEDSPHGALAVVYRTGAAGIVLLASVLVLWAVFRPGREVSGDPPKPGPAALIPQPDPKSPGDDSELLPIDGELPYLIDRTRGEFRRKVAPAKIYDHPYVAYLNAWAENLPESAPKCRTPEEVRDGLRRLLRHLSGREIADLPANALREAIDNALSYESWRQRAGRTDYADQDKPLDPTLRRFVEQFRQPDTGFRDAAKQMAQLLEQWGERDAKLDERRPFTVFDRFFALLIRPAGLPSPPKVDHPKTSFLGRLPPEPVAEGQVFDAEDDLAAALRHLLYLLDRNFNPHARRSMPELLDRIAEQMDYGRWRKARAKQSWRDETMELPENVRDFCKRFE